MLRNLPEVIKGLHQIIKRKSLLENSLNLKQIEIQIALKVEIRKPRLKPNPQMEKGSFVNVKTLKMGLIN